MTLDMVMTFFRYNTKTQSKKEIMENLEFIKIKNFCCTNTLSRKNKQTNKQTKKTNKRKATDWEKIFAKTHLIKDCYLNTQGFLNSTVRKQTTQLKNGPKIFMELLSKKIYK